MTILGKEIKATNKGREGEGGTPIAPRYAPGRRRPERGGRPRDRASAPPRVTRVRVVRRYMHPTSPQSAVSRYTKGEPACDRAGYAPGRGGGRSAVDDRPGPRVAVRVARRHMHARHRRRQSADSRLTRSTLRGSRPASPRGARSARVACLCHFLAAHTPGDRRRTN
jgi:hypothetical protein